MKRNFAKRAGFRVSVIRRNLSFARRAAFFKVPAMNLAALFAIIVLSFVCGLGHGQSPPPPPTRGEGGPRPGERPDERSDRGGGDRGGDRRGGFWPGYGRPPMKSDAYDKLPEEEKKRIREAMDRAWGRPEVINARERTLKAHADLRDAIRVSLEKHDPEVAALLQKVDPPDGYDPRDLPPMPGVDSEEFPKAIVLRLGMEMMMFSKPERKEATRAFHGRLMETEAVKTALKEIHEARGEARIQAAQKLRQVYREAAMHEFQKMRSSPQEGTKPEPK